jgi:hypothetical protein
MMALADEADKRRRQVLAAATLADEQLCRGDNERSPSTTAAIVAAERVGREVAELAFLVVEQERREAAERALALATACSKRVSSFGYSTDFLMRRSVRSVIDSVKKL